MKRFCLITLAVFSGLSLGASSPSPISTEKTEVQNPERAKQLKAFIQKEKTQFEFRENQKKDILGELDKINEQQNSVREKIGAIVMSQSEMAMALENLSLEFERQKELEQLHRKRLYLLLKVAYRVKKEGMLRFVFTGQDLSQLTARVRILYRTLRSQSTATQQLQERAKRLAESEKKLSGAKQDQQVLLDELKSQQELLQSILTRKKQVVQQINKKQNHYQVALKEYKRLSTQLNSIFNQFKTSEDEISAPEAKKSSFVFPVVGKIVQGFGKSVNQKFGTVIYHKGLEIEAEHNSPVGAVASGIVEYAGWVRGLGNVAIVHHGAGLYTLNAHLYKISKEVGSKIEQGETLGTVGDTGALDRPSLYFEVREKGKAVDPIAYFSSEAMIHLN